MPAEEPLTSLGRLVGEASRQLTICNSCRYCEGLCAVYPALERRNLLDAGDVSQLASLCHDCRACYSACMYTDPHEFALNIPAVLASVRLRDYRRYVWPSREPRLATGWLGVFSGSVAATLVVLAVLVLAAAGRRFWVQTGAARYKPTARSLGRAVRYALELRYLRGGGSDCRYPDDEVPSPR
jgi:citrate/tricarballylate utilization protein